MRARSQSTRSSLPSLAGDVADAALYPDRTQGNGAAALSSRYRIDLSLGVHCGISDRLGPAKCRSGQWCVLRKLCVACCLQVAP
jgi:hypothetical protein